MWVTCLSLEIKTKNKKRKRTHKLFAFGPLHISGMDPCSPSTWVKVFLGTRGSIWPRCSCLSAAQMLCLPQHHASYLAKLIQSTSAITTPSPSPICFVFISDSVITKIHILIVLYEIQTSFALNVYINSFIQRTFTRVCKALQNTECFLQPNPHSNGDKSTWILTCLILRNEWHQP